MRKTLGSIALIVVVGAAAAAAWADTHALTSSSRLYMDQERKTEGELWIGPGRSWSKSGNRILISREDLGVWWSIDPGRGSYMEFPLKETEPAAAKAQPDMRKLWLEYYIPEYSWTIHDTGETRDIGGFPCRRFEVQGEADFADIRATYWISESPDVPGGQALRDYILGQIKEDRQRAGQAKIMSDRANAITVLREETIENSIAPTMIVKTTLLKLEEAPAPAGIYDLPAGLKKIED